MYTWAIATRLMEIKQMFKVIKYMNAEQNRFEM